MKKNLVFKPQNTLKTPVLFVVFNRLNTTKLVFEAIRKAKPPRLYIASDGARDNVTGEINKVLEVRDFIIENIDWECDVKTLFRDQNLGCKYSVSSAINWFFNNEECGIILEDDCLPCHSFFWFCEEMLLKYKFDMRIGQISGDNFQQGLIRGSGDYYFSMYNHIWGWATWSSRWDLYDVELDSCKSTDFLNILSHDDQVQEYWQKIYLQTKNKEIDTWDYQWTFCLWYNQMITIVPNYNLVSNIGFGIDATHTHHVGKLTALPTFNFEIKNHPSEIRIDYIADRFTESFLGMKRSRFLIIKKFILKIYRFFNFNKY